MTSWEVFYTPEILLTFWQNISRVAFLLRECRKSLDSRKGSFLFIETRLRRLPPWPLYCQELSVLFMPGRLRQALHVYWPHLNLTSMPGVSILLMKTLKLKEITKLVQVHRTHESFKNLCEEGLAGCNPNCIPWKPPQILVESQNKSSLPPPGTYPSLGI